MLSGWSRRSCNRDDITTTHAIISYQVGLRSAYWRQAGPSRLKTCLTMISKQASCQVAGTGCAGSWKWRDKASRPPQRYPPCVLGKFWDFSVLRFSSLSERTWKMHTSRSWCHILATPNSSSFENNPDKATALRPASPPTQLQRLAVICKFLIEWCRTKPSATHSFLS